MNIGLVGSWSFLPYTTSVSAAAEQLRFLEGLGIKTCWIPEGPGRDAITFSALMLEETKSLCMATGIANIWLRDPETMVSGQRTLWDRFPERFLLGLGVSHQPIVDRQGHHYEKPLTRMKEYLNAMEKTPWMGTELSRTPPTVLAALGDRMLELSRNQVQGAHPYLVPVSHTRHARKVLGDDTLLAPEQAAIYGREKSLLMKLAREHLARYLVLPNYLNNLKQLGFTDEDFEAGGSDRLVEALYVMGDEEVIAERIHDHLAAGADHVALQLLGEPMMVFPEEAWKKLVPALQRLEKTTFPRQPNPVI